MLQIVHDLEHLHVDAPNRAISMDEIFHHYAGLEPLRAFVCWYPMDGILRASGQRCRPINGTLMILSKTRSAFTDQPRLCCRKHRTLQHHPCFRTMINLQPRIRRPQCSSAHAMGTSVAPAADSKRNALLMRSSVPSAKFFARPSARTLTFLLEFDVPETFFRRPPSRVLLFGRLQHRPVLDNFNTV